VTEPSPSDHITLAVLCDRCEAQLVVEGTTRENAREKLRVAIVEAQWRVVDRLEGELEAAVQLTGRASSTMIGALDLCGACAKQL
jgi:6,7-dimethyl-8-ribityllumazine synthase